MPRVTRRFAVGPLGERLTAWLDRPQERPEPVTPVRAATVILMRGSPLEVFMLERATTMEFAPSTWVFPGGRLDPGDVGAAPDAVRLPLVGGDAAAPRPMTASELSERLGVEPSLARGLVVAALRELFEEAGVLLAGRPGVEGLIGVGDRVWAERRIAVEAHETSFTEATQGLVLRGDLLEPVDRWITPEFEPRRFDTWFLEALLPDGATARADTSEASEGRWTTPSAMLALADDGRARLMPPTRVCLERLLDQPSALAALERARDASLEPSMPCLRRDEAGPYLHAEVNP